MQISLSLTHTRVSRRPQAVNIAGVKPWSLYANVRSTGNKHHASETCPNIAAFGEPPFGIQLFDADR